MYDLEDFVNRFEKYCIILKKVVDPVAVDQMMDRLGERLITCPRGLTDEDGGSPGALIEFSLAVAGVAKNRATSFGDPKSLVKVALLHELGKVGGLDDGTDLYLPQDSDWHRDRLGQLYKYNDKCSKMNIAHRTLWLLSHFKIELTREEWVAINLSQGLHLPENQFYARSLDSIAAGLLSARLEVLYGQDT